MYQYQQLTPEEKAALVRERLHKGYPPHSPPHPITDQDFYLLTTACYLHQNRINSSTRRQQLLNQLFTLFINAGIEIRAWVVLPNHYHLLTTTVNFHWLSNELRLIHGRLARQWNLEDNKRGQVWHSYSDRAIRSEKHYYSTINYLHYNPVKHQYCSSPYDWLESSVHWYFENYGREFLRSSWVDYPVHDYGQGWDD